MKLKHVIIIIDLSTVFVGLSIYNITLLNKKIETLNKFNELNLLDIYGNINLTEI